ncbi:hypothetical protein [Bosea sp. (in: a-proteobacteria)]|uniref:hypothetical protein n=1 Tax=Bosea sp. (in: a-proteobacteria) TaxID=1871050 RepID=UPI003B3BBA6F
MARPVPHGLPRVRPAIATLPLLCAALRSGTARAATDPGEIVRDAIRRHGIQTQMPLPEPKAAHWLDWLNIDLSPDALRVLLWGAVILGAAIVIWSLRDSLPGFSRSRRIQAAEVASGVSPSSARLEEAQLEADELARRGQYGEAMHMLLLRSLAEIRARLGTSFAVSLTSREILRKVSLPQAGTGALGAIVQSVEQTYFGGRSAGQEDYLGCRENFEVLKRSLTAGPA